MWPFSSDSSQHVELPDSQLPQSSTVNAPSQPTSPLPPPQESLNPAIFEQDEDQIRFYGIDGQRLGMHPYVRTPLFMFASFTTGFAIGATQGAQIASYRYRAENAHRLPTSTTGWFLYQKSKNYHSMLGGIKEGIKYGGVLTGWGLLFFAAEEGIDRARARVFARRDELLGPGQRDVASTVLAATGVSGVYSWWNGFNPFEAARMCKAAIKYSFLFGLTVDATATLRGDAPAYINWLRSKASVG